jgi:membrane protein implicated in regulation of membrane protease activity
VFAVATSSLSAVAAAAVGGGIVLLLLGCCAEVVGVMLLLPAVVLGVRVWGLLLLSFDVTVVLSEVVREGDGAAREGVERPGVPRGCSRQEVKEVEAEEKSGHIRSGLSWVDSMSGSSQVKPWSGQ